MSYGMDSRIGICFQNGHGTALTSSMHWLEPINESVELKKEQIIREGMRGIYDDGVHQEGLNSVEGDITIEAKAIPLGALLAAVCSRTVVTSGSVRTHTYRPRTSDFDTLSAERPFTYVKHYGDTGSMSIYSDMNGSMLELSVANGELLTATLGMVGGTMTQTAAIAASYPTGTALDWSISSVSINAAAVDRVRDLTVTLENNVEAMHTLGTTKSPSRNKRTGFRAVNISGTLIFDNQTELQSFLAQSEQRMFLHLQSATEIQSGYRESLTIDIPSMRITEYGQTVGGPGKIEQAFSAKGVYNTGSGQSVTITLVNTQAGY